MTAYEMPELSDIVTNEDDDRHMNVRRTTRRNVYAVREAVIAYSLPDELDAFCLVGGHFSTYKFDPVESCKASDDTQKDAQKRIYKCQREGCGAMYEWGLLSRNQYRTISLQAVDAEGKDGTDEE